MDNLKHESVTTAIYTIRPEEHPFKEQVSVQVVWFAYELRQFTYYT
jgi:hypothetical protein